MGPIFYLYKRATVILVVGAEKHEYHGAEDNRVCHIIRLRWHIRVFASKIAPLRSIINGLTLMAHTSVNTEHTEKKTIFCLGYPHRVIVSDRFFVQGKILAELI